MSAHDIIMGAAGASGAAPVYVEDVFSTYLHTGNGKAQSISNGIALGSNNVLLLVGKTLTSLGGSFSGYPLSNVNDSTLETVNAQNIGYVANTSGYFDIYVDMVSAVVLTSYLIAPQGTANSASYNTPTAFTVKGSNDASTWTTVATFSSISTGYPNWNAGTYREFAFTNTTAYRYWRLQCTTYGSDTSGVAVSEWAVRQAVTGTAKGGMVWFKDRTTARPNALFDTLRGTSDFLQTNGTNAQINSGALLSSFNSDGFSLLSDATYNVVNDTNDKYVSWTFAKQPKFFDVVTYTGDGTSNRSISHNLGSAPGCIIIKSTTSVENWNVYHRSISSPLDNILLLNSTSATTNLSGYWGSTAPTSTTFNVGSYSGVNQSGQTYVAYIFAHDAGGFGLTGTDNVISCGSFVGSSPATVNLGWEPQWLLIKNRQSAEGWYLFDSMRGIVTGGGYLFANASNAEAAWGGAGKTILRPTGFDIDWLNPAETYVYIAIRKGPMKVPTDATKVFAPYAYTETLTNPTVLSVGFPTDMYMTSTRSPAYGFYVMDKLRGSTQANNNYLVTPSTAGEGTTGASPSRFDLSNDGIAITYLSNNTAGRTDIVYQFRRAPSFFDEVCYTGAGNGTAQSVNHNLGIAPELMILKKRSNTASWPVYHKDNGNNTVMYLDAVDSKYVGYGHFGYATPTATQFFLRDSGEANAASETYVAYLFATCPGVSKVGSYTGTGTTKQIDCGFTSGARFVLIKRTDSTGSWYVWDTARGIVSGNDPWLLLNSTTAENTSTDYIDPYSAGFELSSSAPGELNASGGSYIYLAIA